MKKNVIITGGAQGIGKTMVLSLLNQGYAVSVFEIDEEAIAEFQEEIPNEVVAMYNVDVSDEQSIQKAIEASVKRFGNIYALINNAAILNNKPISELSLDEWNRVIGTNLTGTFICAKHASPHLKTSKGRIINMASTRALQSRTRY